MLEKGSQQGLIALKGTGGLTRIGGERRQIQRRAIGQGIGLGVTPDILDRVQFWGVRRKQDGAHGGCGVEIAGHGPTAVCFESIPNEQDGSIELFDELAQKTNEEVAVDVGVGMQPEIAAHAITPGRDGECANRGDLSMRASALMQQRRLPPRGPGSTHQGRHEKARFVEKNQGRLQARSVFFTRGHSSLIQRRISVSSRSTARRSGFCGLHPSRCSNRPI